MLEGEYGPCAFNYVEEEEDIESDEENENVSSKKNIDIDM